MTAVEVGSTFSFDRKSVAENFDGHVREQLPWYDLVTEAVAQIARHYVPDSRGVIYDVGAANGNVGRALRSLLVERSPVHYFAIEPSPAMADTYDGPGTLIQFPVEDVVFEEKADLVIALLALIFVPPSRVREVVARIVASLNPGGAFVVVERMLPPDGYLSIVSSRLTLAAKRGAGAPAEEILAKELSLSGVQRPLDRALLEEFGAVEFFRYGDFAGWIIEAAS